MKFLAPLFAVLFFSACAMPPTLQPKRSWTTHPRFSLNRPRVQPSTVYRQQWAAPSRLYNSPQQPRWLSEQPVRRTDEPMAVAAVGGTTGGDSPEQPKTDKDLRDPSAFRLLPLYPQTANRYRTPLNSAPEPSAPAETPAAPMEKPRPMGPYRMSAKQAEFLSAELERMTGILSSPTMRLSERSASAAETLLQPDTLQSWFELERPETQAIYYELLGIPMKKLNRLNLTKQELFEISDAERTELLGYIRETAANFRRTLRDQPGQAVIGVWDKDLP